ncbi:MAG: sensor histidine kinase [Rhodobiaceae bacterium]|nr:sensor histidine kinase [Rhodobiaceae bacterium]
MHGAARKKAIWRTKVRCERRRWWHNSAKTQWEARIIAGFFDRIAVLSLSQRFAAAGGVVMIIAALVIGTLVTSTVRRNAVAANAAATALFMDSFISPLAQELAESDSLSIGPIRALDELLATAPLKDRVVSIKIWKPGGLVAYATDTDLIGKTFDEVDALARARDGKVVAELEDLDEPESASEKKIGIPLLEIYSPVRENWTGKTIAVAEFYENAEALEEAIAEARMTSWAAVLITTLLIGLSLFGIVNAGSRTIERQRRTLAEQVAASTAMSVENRRLRLRAERANARVHELTEARLRTAAADLHDGPAQLVSLAALRLDTLRGSDGSPNRKGEIDAIDGALKEAIREIRNICQGLSLPELENLSLNAVATRAIAAHESVTAQEIEQDIALGEQPAPIAAKACLYRFLQEGLANASKHASGGDVVVACRLDGPLLTASVANSNGVNASSAMEAGGLGLAGLRHRIESLGGTCDFVQAPDDGARLSMEIDLAGGAFHD